MGGDPRVEKINSALLAAFKTHVERFVPQFANRIYLSWELLGLAERLGQVRVQGFEPKTADVILYGTASRGMKTYRGSLYLCCLGFGPQAMILNRSLIEDALTARWAELHRDEALERLTRHEQHMLYLFAETMKKRELDPGALADLDPLTDEELAQATSDFGQHGELAWTGHSIWKLFEKVADEWGDQKERDLLVHMRSFALRYANLTTHNTAASIAKPTFIEDDRPFYNAGESKDDIGAALLSGFWAFGNLYRVVLYGEQREEFEAFYADHIMEFFQPER
jgi:Family of unknown function (DUF5677)